MKQSRGADRTERFRRARSRKSRRPLAIAGIAVFLAVDAVLVGYAMVNGRGAAADNADAAVAVSTPSATRSATPTATASGKPAASPTAPQRPTRLISAVSDTIAWRGSAGTCTPNGGGQAAVELSTDSGANWAQHEVPGLSSISRISATSADQLFVVGQRADTCELTLAVTYSGGASFADRAEDLASAWYVDPADTSRVHTPGDTLESPCPDVLELGVESPTSASVRCADGSLMSTQSGGTTWVPRDGLEAVRALSSDGAIALSGDDASCRVIDIASGAPLADPADACDDVALAYSDAATWIWSGQSVSIVART
ncbi:hypothetical protein ACTHQN_13595 [Curtobacterium flaccumfaciens]|uniref:hypothetical protein n=1 Tax=Curtobacterium flaccumfaciens TaxID=2035 RepID=UPI003F803A36